MREIIPSQPSLGQTNIADIIISDNSRDDIPNILKGLQYIYTDPDMNAALSEQLKNVFNSKQLNVGRIGMNVWSIFVLATLRVNLSWDYDRLHQMANQHIGIREMLGHDSVFNNGSQHSLQTIKDNVRMLTPETLEGINQTVVMAGHKLLNTNDGDMLKGRTDSFVLETNVHFPTDVGLLQDAMRKAIKLSYDGCRSFGFSHWRQHGYNVRHLKSLLRNIQLIKKGKGKDKEEKLIAAHQKYIDAAKMFINKLECTLEALKDNILSIQIRNYLDHAYRQIDQIERRAIKGETIPASEKVYSIFEPHTEWVNKGKAGGKIELGIKVCIIEDQHQFILHHRVMQKEADSDIAELIVKECQELFPNFKSCSFDKGFDSAANQEALSNILDEVTMPKKGKLSQERKEVEHEAGFIKTRHQHSAVESAINCLEQHGLDKCRDKGIDGFKRYVAIAIVGRNIQRIGSILRAKARAQEQRKIRKFLKAA